MSSSSSTRSPLAAVWLVAGVLAFASPAFSAVGRAQSSAAPAGATAKCKDGTYSTAKTQRGACSGHGGVATTLGAGSAKTDDSPKATRSTTSAPADATGQCKDGSYTTAATKRGACSGHGGVSTWRADANAAPASPTPAPSPAPAPAPAPRSTPGAQNQDQIHTPPANAPQNATARCNDGTFSFAKQHRGACSGHKGVSEWFK